jgi:hypothetical protein
VSPHHTQSSNHSEGELFFRGDRFELSLLTIGASDGNSRVRSLIFVFHEGQKTFLSEYKLLNSNTHTGTKFPRKFRFKIRLKCETAESDVINTQVNFTNQTLISRVYYFQFLFIKTQC